MTAADVSNCHCLKIRRLSRIVTTVYDRELAPTGLRVTQFTVLNAVAALQSSHTTAGQIADALNLDASSLSRALSALKVRGYVTVVRAGQRSGRVRITEKGTQKLSKARPHWEVAQAKVEAALSTESTDKLDQMIAATRPLSGAINR